MSEQIANSKVATLAALGLLVGAGSYAFTRKMIKSAKEKQEQQDEESPESSPRAKKLAKKDEGS